MKHRIVILIAMLAGLVPAFGQNHRDTLDIELTNYEYPYDVRFLTLNSQRQALKMAYMDVRPKHPNGSAVMLLHGKNFNGAYWQSTIAALVEAGYRVVVPDQIGFGKSSKPEQYQYSFQQLAINTMELLNHLKIDRLNVLGHSMGGMLAMRFALMYPATVGKLILENPIGLEDWKRVVPYTPVDKLYEKELQADFQSVKKYQLENYYDGKWRPEYDEWVYLLTGWSNHPDYPRVAWNNALTSDMIFTQPVYYEMANIQAATLLIIGTRDRTAIGKQYVSADVQATLGQYQELGKAAKQKISRSLLVELDNVGHMPHIEAFDRFIQPLLRFLSD